LIQKGVNFNEYDVLKDPSLKPIMIERTNGAKTVPQIFFNEQHIGGCEQLFGLDQNGKLDEILSKK
jgi:glutaredoxin 3